LHHFTRNVFPKFSLLNLGLDLCAQKLGKKQRWTACTVSELVFCLNKRHHGKKRHFLPAMFIRLPTAYTACDVATGQSHH